VDEQDFTYLGYNLRLSVQARRVLLFEAHTHTELKQLVWDEQANFFEELAKQRPKALTCLRAERHRNRHFKGYSTHVDIVNPVSQETMYLGTVVSKSRAEGIYRFLLSEFPPNMAEAIKAHGSMAIVRWWYMASIPVNNLTLNQLSVEQGIQKYVALFAPKLAGLPIEWLPTRKQLLLELFITERARSTAKSQSEGERVNTFGSDIV